MKPEVDPSDAAVRLEDPPKAGFFGRLIRIGGFVATLGVIAGGIGGVVMYGKYSEDLPSFTSVDQYRPKLVSKVFSVDGRLIGEFGLERRIVVPYERVPKRLTQAFIATEDKKFFDHHGIDFVGIARAVIYRVIGKSERLGGTSTITQQLAKSLLISHEGFAKGTERSIRRKAREAILARRLESVLNKEQIIWLYLNQVYLGHGAYGVQAAAENYFRKNVDELNLGEMSIIAGLPQAPSRFSPFVNPKSARARQKIVLDRMVKNGFISDAERTEALAIDIEGTVHARDDRFRDTAPYFTEHVRRHLYDTYGEKALYEGGLRVYTTLDLERQRHAEVALVNGVLKVDKRQGYLGPMGNVKGKKRAKALAIIDKQFLGAHADKRPAENEHVPAVVDSIDRKKRWAVVSIGTKHKAILPIAGMRWARKVNPNRFWQTELVNRISERLKVGDLILVAPRSRKRLVELGMTTDAIRALPKTAPDGMLMVSLEQEPKVEGALVSMQPSTGYVEAMIGGFAFERSEFNRAFQSCRMPGSSFKPIVYSAAVKYLGYTPATMITDTPITVHDADVQKSWKPQNFELEYKGEVTAREAVMNSMNIPALRTMQKLFDLDYKRRKKEGIKKDTRMILRWAKTLGIQTELKDELGTAIGSSCVRPWELTNAYTTFARMGLRPEPVFIKRVEDRDGKVLEAHASPNDPWQSRDARVDNLYRMLESPAYRVMDHADAFITNYFLTQVATHGTAARARGLGHPVAGKTGTTNDSFDTWFVGYTPSLVTSVWVGYDRMEYPLSSREQGGRTALPIWLTYMKNALDGVKEKPWPLPKGVCEARVDSTTGARVFGAPVGSFIAPFKCGTEPKAEAAAGTVTQEDAMMSGDM